MKKITFLSIILCFVLAISVSAVQDFEIQESSDSIAGEPGDSISGSFTLENTGDEDLTITFNENDLEKGSESVDINSISSVSLPNGSTKTVSFTVDIPNGQEGGTYTGTIEAVSGGVSDTIDVTLDVQVDGELSIQDLDVSLTTLPRYKKDSERDTHLNVEDGETLTFDDNDIGPGSELRFDFEIENTFSTNEDVEIEDVFVNLRIDEIDDGDEIEEETENINIEAADSANFLIELTIPLAVEEETYDVLIEVEGDGDDGKTYKTTMDLKLTVDKEGRDIFIEESSIFPKSVKCSGRSTVAAVIQNLGTREEDDVSIAVKNTELGLNFRQENIRLDEDPFDDDAFHRVSVPVNVPEGIRAKTYPIKVEAYLQGSSLWDERTLNLAVTDCAVPEDQEEPEEEETPEEEVEEEQEAEETEETQNTQEEQEENNQPITTIPIIKPTETTEKTFTQGPLFWPIIILFNLIVVGLIVYAVLFMAKR